jgi:preprotein translocase subunit YajC
MWRADAVVFAGSLGLRFENAGAFVRLFIGKKPPDAMPNLVLNSFVTPLLAQAAPTSEPAPGPGGAGSLMGLLPFVLMFAAMWFLLIAPQRKKQKEHQKLINSLATGDEVLTSGGIYGVVTNVKPDRVIVKIADNTKIEIARSFVTSVEKKTAAE